MRVKKVISVLVLCLVMLFTFFMWKVTYAADDLTGFLPDTSQLTQSGIPSLYDKYEFYNYTFDVTEGKNLLDMSKTVVMSIFSGLTDIVFLGHVLISKFVTALLISCYKVNIFDIIPDGINQIVFAIKKGLFDGLYEIILSFAGLFGIYKTIQGSKTTSVKVSISSLVVLGLSIAFFENPSGFAQDVNKGTGIICSHVLFEVSKTTGVVSGQTVASDDDAVVLLGNNYWNIDVLKPYEFIEFGEMNKYDPNEFLQLTSDDDRQELVQKYTQDKNSKSYFFFSTIRGQIVRFVLALFIFVIGLVQNACMLLISCIIFFNQIGALFWICFAGVFFLAALYPGNGLMLLVNWMIETFGFEIKRIVITISLSIYFGITSTIYSLTGKYGYVMVMVFNIAALIFAIIKRDKVYQLIMGMVTGNQGMINNGMKHKEGLAGKFSKAVVTAYAGQRLYNGFKNRMEQNARKGFDKKYRKKAEDVLTQRYNTEKHTSRNGAEKRLKDKYDREKSLADKRAERMNGRPEYSDFVNKADQRKQQGLSLFTDDQINSELKESDFVRQVDDRKAKGFNNVFSDDQIKSTLGYMYNLKKEGNDPNRLTFTDVEGKSGDQIQRDQAKKDKDIKDTKDGLKRTAGANNRAIEDNIERVIGTQNTKYGMDYYKVQKRDGSKRLKPATPKDARRIEDAIRKAKYKNSGNKNWELATPEDAKRINAAIDAAPEPGELIASDNDIKALPSGGIHSGENFIMYEPGGKNTKMGSANIEGSSNTDTKTRERIQRTKDVVVNKTEKQVEKRDVVNTKEITTKEERIHKETRTEQIVEETNVKHTSHNVINKSNYEGSTGANNSAGGQGLGLGEAVIAANMIKNIDKSSPPQRAGKSSAKGYFDKLQNRGEKGPEGGL